MEAILKVTPETLVSSASELEQEGQTMKLLTDQMLALIREISGEVWSGEAALSYRARFQGLESSMERIHGLVREHVQDLHEIAGMYRNAELENQELAESLTSEVLL